MRELERTRLSSSIVRQRNCGVRYMRKTRPYLKGACLVCLLIGSVKGLSIAQETKGSPTNKAAQSNADLAPAEYSPAPVEIDGRPIFLVYGAVGGISPGERASNIKRRISDLAKHGDLPVSSVHIEDRGPWTEIVAGDKPILDVSEYDARIANRPRSDLASEYAEIIRRTVTSYRQAHSWDNLIRAWIYTAISSAGLFVSFLLLFRLRRIVRSRIQRWTDARDTTDVRRTVFSRSLQFLGRSSLAIARLLFWLLLFVLLNVYVTLLLSFYPATRYNSNRIIDWIFSQLADLAGTVAAYLPNLLVVAAVCLVAYYLIRLDGYIFAEIREGRLKLQSFYPEWAEPTAKLVRLLILVATAIVAFPYLPASDSPAFRGISVFLGVLLSLGSTSSVAHVVAGTILTYMRSFSVGDFVKIGDTVGVVIERNLLVTRVRTQKQEVVTIPNGSVLGGVVVNYSAEARNNGVLFHTKVSIAYNAPWKEVHDLLVAAALSTKDVLKQPQPFVLQSSLDDFYVSYELNAFTAHPQNMQFIYSDLHRNIQDRFNEGGIEINSPHYVSIRDGNRIAVPDEYIAKDYQEPGFRIGETKNSVISGK
jgi:small-conductance mechanosensitive channel